MLTGQQIRNEVIAGRHRRSSNLSFVPVNRWLSLAPTSRNEADGIMIWLLRHNQ